MNATVADREIEPSGPDIDIGVMKLYARSAHRYDRVNTLASLGTSNWYRRRTILSLDLPSDARVVDVGTGTGALSIAAQRYLPDSPSIVAVDPCPEMRLIPHQSSDARRLQVAEKNQIGGLPRKARIPPRSIHPEHDRLVVRAAMSLGR